ncbi:MAG TPA: hypothetical protein PLP16_09735 [Smithellaceae bacterium]|nr:hypothetical protein [Smithellaceae bacterium]
MDQIQELCDVDEINRQVEEQVEIERAEYSSGQACQGAADDDGGRCPFSSADVIDALNRNEDGDAWLYIEIHSGRFCYDTAAGCWYKWSGHYWEEDLLNDALRSIRDVIEVYLCELDRISVEEKKEVTCK